MFTEEQLFLSFWFFSLKDENKNMTNVQKHSRRCCDERAQVFSSKLDVAGSVQADLQPHLVLLLLFWQKKHLIIQQQLEGSVSHIWNKNKNSNRCG